MLRSETIHPDRPWRASTWFVLLLVGIFVAVGLSHIASSSARMRRLGKRVLLLERSCERAPARVMEVAP